MHVNVSLIFLLLLWPFEKSLDLCGAPCTYYPNRFHYILQRLSKMLTLLHFPIFLTKSVKIVFCNLLRIKLAICVGVVLGVQKKLTKHLNFCLLDAWQ